VQTTLDVRLISGPSIKLGVNKMSRRGDRSSQRRWACTAVMVLFHTLVALCLCQLPTRLRTIMSEDTRNWRPLLSSAANKLQTFKGYLATKDPRPLSPASSSSSFQRGDGDPASCAADPGSGTRQSWTQWAGDKLRRSGQPEGNNVNVVEKVSLFPGWAARRLHNPSPGEGARSLRITRAVLLNICPRQPLRC